MGKFSDVPYFILKDFFDTQLPYNYVYPHTGKLRGAKSGIVADSGFGVDLYIKTTDPENNLSIYEDQKISQSWVSVDSNFNPVDPAGFTFTIEGADRPGLTFPITSTTAFDSRKTRISLRNDYAFLDFGSGLYMNEGGHSLIYSDTTWTGAAGMDVPPTGWALNAGCELDIFDSGDGTPHNVCLKIAYHLVDWPGVTKTYTTVPGQKYRFTVDFKHGNGSGGGILLGVGWNELYANLQNLTDATWTTYSVDFTATTTATSLILFFQTGTAGQYELFDEVKLSEITRPIALGEFIGKKITVTDSNGHSICGYITHPGSVETYSADLLTNGDFSMNTDPLSATINNVTGWGSNEATLEVLEDYEHDYCLSITRLTGIFQSAGQTVVPLYSGLLYILRASVKSGTSGNQKYYLGKNDAAGINYVYGNGVSTENWADAYFLFKATAEAQEITLTKYSDHVGSMLFADTSLVSINTPSITGVKIGNAPYYPYLTVRGAEYAMIKARPYPSYLNGNTFKFHLETNYSEMDMNDLVNYVGAEVYFRRGCPFHGFVNSSEDYLRFINEEKLYCYFGTIYPITGRTGDAFNIVFEGLKDHVVKALPENNQTDKMVAFLSDYYDQVHNEPYWKIKDLWSLQDPMDIDPKYLGYMARIYDFDLLENLSIDDEREYVANLPELLKRKGTFTSIFILWKLLSKGSINYCNIYERWHPWDVSGIPLSYFEDILYTDYPYYDDLPPTGGAGLAYYWSFETTGSSGYHDYMNGDYVLSPHYRVEVDLSNEPLGNDYIMNEYTIDALITRWEQMRPAMKFVHYHELIAPIADLTGHLIPLYTNTTRSANLVSKCCQPSFAQSEWGYVFSTTVPSKTWLVNHNMNTASVMISCYDKDFFQMVPKTVEYVTNNTTKVTWSYAVAGFACATGVDYTGTLYSGQTSASWDIHHSLGLDYPYPLVQINDATGKEIYPMNIHTVDVNNLTITWPDDVTEEELGSVLVAHYDYLHVQDDHGGASTTWTINHNLGSRMVEIFFWDEDGDDMYPATLQLVSETQAVATFNVDYPSQGGAPPSGYAAVKLVVDQLDLMTDLDTVKLGSGTSGPNWNPQAWNNIEDTVWTGSINPSVDITEDDHYYYIDIDIPAEDAINITEIGIFGTYNLIPKIVFYTYCGPIYKPDGVTMKIWYRVKKLRAT